MPPRNSLSPSGSIIPAAVALLTVALVLSGAARADPAPRSVERSEEDLLLLAVKLDSEVLEPAMTAYPAGDDVLLPLGWLTRTLALAVEVDVAAGTASGFFIDERRKFQLDTRTGEAIIEGVKVQAAPGQLEVHEDDVYVARALLAKWFPLDLVIDRHAALVVVKPREPLPIQLQRERALKMKTALANLKRQAGRDLPQLPIEYGWFSGPFLDQTVNVLFAQGTAAAPTTDVRYSSYLTGELLFLDASAFLAGSSSGFSDARARLGRRDPERRLLGPLGASEIAFGDVSAPGLELISNSSAGEGAVLSNFPLNQASEYDRHTFRGDLPPGWEVELYRNDALLGFQGSRGDGQYEFVDVPLLFGPNEFRRVFHGPHGQQREEVDRFDVGQQQTPPGELRYRLVAHDPRLLDPRGSLELEFGVHRHLAASAAATVIQVPAGLRNYGRVGLRGFWSAFAMSANVAGELSGGVAAHGQLRTRVGRFGLNAEHLQLWDFEAERILSVHGPLRSRTELDLDGTIALPGELSLPVTLELAHDRLESGEWVNTAGGRLSGFYRGFAASQQLSWTLPRPGSSISGQALGSALFSYSMPTASIRAQVDHRIAPDPELISTGISFDARLLPGYTLSAGTHYSPASGFQYLFGLGKQEGMIGFSINAGYSRTTGTSLGLALTFGVGRDPRSGDWLLRNSALAGSGAASVRAFLDKNGNDRFDEGEPLLPQVGFSVNGGYGDDRTAADGTMFLPNLQAHRPVDVMLVPSTLEDPYWRPSQEGVRIIPRPGKVVKIDVPVTVSGEAFGTVFVRRAGESEPIAGIVLQLVDAEGNTVQTVRTAFDGFYDLPDLRPGRYTIRFDREQMLKLNILPPFPHTLVIAPDGTVVENLDFTLDSTTPSERRR